MRAATFMRAPIEEVHASNLVTYVGLATALAAVAALTIVGIALLRTDLAILLVVASAPVELAVTTTIDPSWLLSASRSALRRLAKLPSTR